MPFMRLNMQLETIRVRSFNSSTLGTECVTNVKAMHSLATKCSLMRHQESSLHKTMGPQRTTYLPRSG